MPDTPPTPSRPARWLVLSVPRPPRGHELGAVDALRGLGARSVEPGSGAWAAWFEPPTDLPVFVARVRAALERATPLRDPEVAHRWEPWDTWLARRAREAVPVRVSPRLAVAPPEVQVRAPVVVRLTPGVAFGGAEHPTTRACLAFLERRLRPGDTVLDAGTGSGVLAIASALLGAAHVVAAEADGLACLEARDNAGLNGVDHVVQVVHATLTPGRLPEPGPFHGVVANLEGSLLLPLFSTLAGAVRPGGWLAVAGLVAPERAPAVAAAEASALVLDAERRDRSWWSGLFSRSTARWP